MIPRRILYLGYALSDQGAPHQAMAALWMARQGAVVRYEAFGRREPAPWLGDYPSMYYRQTVVSRRPGALLSMALSVARGCQQFSPDVLYVQGAQQTVVALCLLAVIRIPNVVYHTQDYLEPGQHWLYEKCEKVLAKRADLVVSNEINRARFMASNYRLRVVPSIVRTALPTWWLVPTRDPDVRTRIVSQQVPATSTECRLIAAGGGYGESRMSPELLRALQLLPEYYHVVFTGVREESYEHQRLNEEAAELGVSKRVIVMPSLPHDELLSVYAACDVGMLLYPSSGIGHFYQAPGRLTEYLRCGVPVVASNFPGLELMVVKHGLGAVACPTSVEEIAAAISSVCERSEEDLVARRQRLREWAIAEFGYERDAASVLGPVVGEA